jgi:hypothetical protein
VTVTESVEDYLYQAIERLAELRSAGLPTPYAEKPMHIVEFKPELQMLSDDILDWELVPRSLRPAPVCIQLGF